MAAVAKTPDQVGNQSVGVRNRIASVLQWAAGAVAPSPPQAAVTTPPRQKAEDLPGDLAPVTTGSRGYEGASIAPRLSPWRPSRLHINSLLASDGPMLRARTRQLVANTPYGANGSETFAAYATGTGIKPASQIANPDQKAAVQQAWTDWTDESDADGLTDFYGQQTLAARALFDAGEVFVRFRPRYSTDGFLVPLQLQLLEAEQLDQSMTLPAGNGNMIRQGIEFDAIGRRVAYHFWAVHPGDGTIMNRQGEKTRVPASDVAHVYKPLRPGQIRGRPWLTAGMVKMYDLDQYDDAELSRKKAAAMFMAFLTKNIGADGASLVDGAVEPDDQGLADLVMEPSVMNILPDGVDVKFSGPADVGPNYEAFQIRNLYALCASMGLPYHAVTGDVSKANYSSLRASLVEVRRRIEQFQHETLVFQLCRVVWARWLPTAVLAGAVQLPGFTRNQRELMRVKWFPPKWDWVDPLKDAQAEKLQVDSGFKSRSDVIEERGEDPEVVDQRIADDKAREKNLGLEFQQGFTKAPDAPKGGTDINPAGGDQQQQRSAAAMSDEPLPTSFRALIDELQRRAGEAA